MKIDLKRFTGPCSCGRTHAVTVQGIYIETDATRYLEEILRAYHHPVIICDSNTKRAAASKLNDYYQKYTVIELTNDAVYADNQNVQTLRERLEVKADMLIAVGAGTIHDLTRFIAYERGIPFVSVLAFAED